MSVSRWIIDPALVITFLGCFGALLFIAVDFAYLKAKEDVTEETQSGPDADQAKRHITEVCSSLSGAEWRKCLMDVIEPQQKQSQDYRDLHAQERMARWAFWMLVVAAAGTAVAGYGLVLIKRTWIETKRTADITREMGQAQVRAYLSIDTIKASASVGETEVRLSFDVAVKNCGQSPARGVFLVVDEHRNTDGEPYFRVMFGDIPAGVTVKRKAKESFSLRDLRLLKNDEALVNVRFTVRGEDVFRKTVKADEWFQAKTTITDGGSFELQRPNVTIYSISNGTDS